MSSAATRLPRAIQLDALSDTLGAIEPSWRPAPAIHTASDVTRGPFSLRVESWRQTCGPLTLTIEREAGDNGATHHMAWEAVFEARATLAGLPRDSVLRFEQTGWGAVDVTHARAQGAAAERLLAALITHLSA